MLCFHTSLQALDSFLPETAAELCHLVHTHVTGCGALGEEPRWFAAVQLMEIAGACMVRGGGHGGVQRPAGWAVAQAMSLNSRASWARAGFVVCTPSVQNVPGLKISDVALLHTFPLHFPAHVHTFVRAPVHTAGLGGPAQPQRSHRDREGAGAAGPQVYKCGGFLGGGQGGCVVLMESLTWEARRPPQRAPLYESQWGLLILPLTGSFRVPSRSHTSKPLLIPNILSNASPPFSHRLSRAPASFSHTLPLPLLSSSYRSLQACETGIQPAALGGDDRWEASVVRFLRSGWEGKALRQRQLGRGDVALGEVAFGGEKRPVSEVGVRKRGHLARWQG